MRSEPERLHALAHEALEQARLERGEWGEGDAHARSLLRAARLRGLESVHHLGGGAEQALPDRELEQQRRAHLGRLGERHPGATHGEVADLAVHGLACMAQRDRQADRHAEPTARLEPVAAGEHGPHGEAELARVVRLPEHPADAPVAERGQMRALARRAHDQQRLGADREAGHEPLERRIERAERQRAGHDERRDPRPVLDGEQHRLVGVARVERIDALREQRERGRSEHGVGSVQHERAAVVALHPGRIGRLRRTLKA